MKRSAKKKQRAVAPTELSVEEARVIIEPYFHVVRDIFCAFCVQHGLGDEVKKTRFECRTDVHDTERHFAGASTDGNLIVCAVQLPDLPEDTLAAILAHEFGHIVDHKYPGRFLLVEDELVLVEDADVQDPRAGNVRVARAKQWGRRDYYSIERTADLIAEQATGSRIGYSGQCMLQGLNRGVPRPKNLR